MKINDIITEATYGIDTRYSAEDLNLLFHAANDISRVALKNLGITIQITSHFKDQIQMKRNRGPELLPKITPVELIDAFSRILNRGLKFFKNKEEGTNYVFFDQQTLLNIPLIKKAETRYAVPTILKSRKYYGRDQKITL
jgi:hypothetical protein